MPCRTRPVVHRVRPALALAFAQDYKPFMQPDKPESNAPPEGTPAPAGVLDLAAFRACLLPGQRLIGIDVGTKTLGLALSDVGRTIATGLETLKRRKFSLDAAELLARVAEHKVGGLVIGLPLNLDGTEGPRSQSTRAFARNMTKLTPLPMLLWDERLSTQAAERTLLESDASRRRRAEVIDKMAATIILQTALDRMRHA